MDLVLSSYFQETQGGIGIAFPEKRRRLGRQLARQASVAVTTAEPHFAVRTTRVALMSSDAIVGIIAIAVLFIWTGISIRAVVRRNRIMRDIIEKLKD